MKHVKLFENWLNESLPTDGYFTTCLDTVIYMCLRSFSPVDGNPIENDNITNLVVSMRPELFASDSPDFWVNCGDFDGKINAELKKVGDYYGENSSNRKEVDAAFKEYGMEVSTLHEDEVIVSIYLPYNMRTMNPEYLNANAEAVVKFYEETQPKGLESFEKDLKNHLTANKFGL